MTERKHFDYANSTTITTPLRKTDTYTYDSTWKDWLTGYNGTNNIQYDAIGNPTDYLGKTLEWTQGRRRKNVNGTTSYRYNESGFRTSKTENGVTTQYFWQGKQLMSQSNTSGLAREFVYWYDASGDLVGFRYNGTHYYYVKKLQGDVIGILDSSHNVVVRYAYDTWGKLLKIRDGNDNDVTNNTSHIGYLNPIRYRSYLLRFV